MEQFPGSTQKRDFLNKLTVSLIDKLLHSQIDSTQLFKSMYTSLNTNQIFISIPDEAAASILHELTWDGSVMEPACPTGTPDCLNDYNFLVDANLGVNKVNYYITRTLNYQVAVNSAGEYLGTMKIKYQNHSQTNTWKGGNYKNYLRLLVPEGSKLDSVVVNSQNLPKDQIIDETLHSHRTFGFLVNVQPQTSTEVSIKYKLPFKVTSGPKLYQLTMQKQSGTTNDPLTIELNLPPAFQMTNPNGLPSDLPNPYQVTRDFKQNFTTQVEITP
jgi:hypothetical protein